MIAGLIHKRIQTQDDLYLLAIVQWFIYFIDTIFDITFNVHLWISSFYGLACASLLCMIVPMIIDILQLYRYIGRWRRDIPICDRVNQYLEKRGCLELLYIFAVLSGSSHAVINITNVQNIFFCFCSII